ncbi:sarcosine oxidase subunit gamma family protein [Novosphingobium sp.]|uniref:sarcosine oxidase subunit gamma n=1 Tax=Novosphingobium sp. TaxID=1874826 RepID=UPI0025CCE9C8|nr:sarcosine oxidase subunit gamma family protein [Novosphingobium sp.]MCC6924243.1 sarcosine oxidase gamma subunit [Novosphingobium sp.]
MADAAVRTAPVPAEAAEFPGVSIALGAPLARWSLRARDPKALAKAIGHKVPGTIGETLGGMACLGPDEWLLRLPEGASIPLGEGLPLSVVDISERAVTLVLDGDRAIDALSAGCPRDLSKFPVGYATRTIFETVEIVLIRESETRWSVDVWRSFAPYLWTALTTAASHLR